MDTFIFFLLLFLLVYLYIGYLIIIYILAYFFPLRKIKTNDDYIPKVTVMVPVKNEEFTILDKLKNLSELDYPRDKLQIIIIDSDSDDNTLEIIKKS